MGHLSKVGVAMPLHTGERAIVHVVDDDASLHRALADLFDSVGLATRTYATARDLVSASLDDAPGCLVIDVRLPDVNGLEFQARLTQIGVTMKMRSDRRGRALRRADKRLAGRCNRTVPNCREMIGPNPISFAAAQSHGAAVNAGDQVVAVAAAGLPAAFGQ